MGWYVCNCPFINTKTKYRNADYRKIVWKIKSDGRRVSDPKYKFGTKIIERVRGPWQGLRFIPPRNRRIIITYVPPSTNTCIIKYFLCRKRWAFGFGECDWIFIVLRVCFMFFFNAARPLFLIPHVIVYLLPINFKCK